MAGAVVGTRALAGLDELAPALALSVEVVVGIASYVAGALVFARASSEELVERLRGAFTTQPHPAGPRGE
jgi:hypothetical protein